MVDDGYAPLWVSASDGLKLFARDYGPPASSALPAVCLPGLSRNSSDFHDLALALAGDAKRPRRVLALDYRGRGRSDYDPDPKNYDLKVELGDVLHVLTAAGVEEAVFVGTSRGGILTMALSAARPALLRGAVLNDIGPVLEAQGLARIQGYVGKLPLPRDLTEGAATVKKIWGGQFPAFTDADWLAMARGTWKEADGVLALNYDPNLAKPLQTIDLGKPLPSFWPLFEGLKRVPVLALRGEHSDLFSADTLAAMGRAHPRFEAVTVPGQGHAPSLAGRDVIETIKRFVAWIEDAGPLTRPLERRPPLGPSSGGPRPHP
jgi:pimeloyl-ACP methyl ester carboxylesterase